MDWQADDEPVDPFFFGQRLKIIAVERGRSPRVIVKRPGDSYLGISQCDADSDGAVIDAGNSHVCCSHRSIGCRFSAVSKCPCSKNRLAYSCTRLSFMKKLCSTGSKRKSRAPGNRVLSTV